MEFRVGYPIIARVTEVLQGLMPELCLGGHTGKQGVLQDKEVACAKVRVQERRCNL